MNFAPVKVNAFMAQLIMLWWMHFTESILMIALFKVSIEHILMMIRYASSHYNHTHTLYNIYIIYYLILLKQELINMLLIF